MQAITRKLNKYNQSTLYRKQVNEALAIFAIVLLLALSTLFN